jgi:hypothetical protein
MTARHIERLPCMTLSLRESRPFGAGEGSVQNRTLNPPRPLPRPTLPEGGCRQ